MRNGTAKAVMSLSKDDSIKLWKATESRMLNDDTFPKRGKLLIITLDDIQSYNSVHSKLLNHPGSELRHCPIKIYLPRAAQEEDAAEEGSHASLRVIQAPVRPRMDAGMILEIMQFLQS